jgi:small subunit ribosomal protein S16
MVRIRLRRMGAKGQPSYRIVVADSRAPRDGRFIEVIGFYNPLVDPPQIEVNEERLRYWLGVGAQCSDGVEALLAARERARQQAR